mmetsp:Transcript_32323/g.53447  ORF Transcript_32323/g.53447 Transcript_32323/m.53447 type:complete len:238 (+) Transcript_32323:125-838(+)|eukprot:CAMPEP_0119028610 /NCGR_PEP_ID=MMETSP1176-20130426/39189_1 /TAXON_ID=265551 /ORGANISM="Synedropsis recta cf, Strain CCMP1620" /LENGTH=237 /DNA_ID=CAMNT_0006984783 /DNA_START=109 /DNA_END=822 /DNA_ORIENTATION=+
MAKFLSLFRRHPRRNKKTTRRPTDDTPESQHAFSSDLLQQEEEINILEPDPELVRLLSLNPWDAVDRERYDDAAVQRLIETNPQAACVKHEFQQRRRGRRGTLQYPLFRAAALGASLTVVTLLGDACPASFHETGVPADGKTALHSACAYQASLEVIVYLLTQNPDAAGCRNKHGYTPLQNACEYGASSPEVILVLQKACPQALGWKNKLGQTPYQTAERKGADAAILSILTLPAGC